jgi:hypothetical protein
MLVFVLLFELALALVGVSRVLYREGGSMLWLWICCIVLIFVYGEWLGCVSGFIFVYMLCDYLGLLFWEKKKKVGGSAAEEFWK